VYVYKQIIIYGLSFLDLSYKVTMFVSGCNKKFRYYLCYSIIAGLVILAQETSIASCNFKHACIQRVNAKGFICFFIQ